jgi:hypothetical protein
MIDWKTFKATGVQAVDMCANTIYVNRRNYIPVKAIHLVPRLYGQFRLWTEKNIKRELNEDEGIEFDGVYIEKGTDSQSTPLVVELWAN